MLERSNLDKLLDDSVKALNDYQTKLQDTSEVSPDTDHQADPLSELVAVLSGTSMSLKNILKQKRADYIDANKLRAVREAIERLISEPNTENKVNLVQFAIFGINLPLMQVLKEMQDLLHTVEGLKETRGKRVSHIEKMDHLEDET